METRLNKKIFMENFTMLCEIYNTLPTKGKLEAYYFVLQEMDEDDFKKSIIEILKTRKFASLPKPAEILEYSLQSIDELSILAIEDIERAIYSHGAYKSVSFEDSVVNSVIDSLGGWSFICSMELNDWKFAKKDIPKLYAIKYKSKSHPEHLIGIGEKENGFANKIYYIKPSYEIKRDNIAIENTNNVLNKINLNVKRF